MRIWILESTTKYGCPDRKASVYESPASARDDLVEWVIDQMFSQNEFHLRLLVKNRSGKPNESDFVLQVDSPRGDAVTLSGLYVEKTGAAKISPYEERSLRECATLLMRRALHMGQFIKVTEYCDAKGPTGVWRFRKKNS